MITQRHLGGTAGADATLRQASGLSPKFSEAEASAGASLTPGYLKASALSATIEEALPAQKPLMELEYRPPNYESPMQTFRTAYHLKRRFLVPYPPAPV